AGVDIVLMPVSISSPSQASLLPDLIRYIVDMVKKDRISEADIDASVERILSLKKRYNLLSEDETVTAGASPSEHELEK
ncbi:glycoside hydrolase family 3 protein, partial [Pectobacterium versatile]|nr:glycoside hydrolase family 3 protein [Pectobacterium versatile]